MTKERAHVRILSKTEPDAEAVTLLIAEATDRLGESRPEATLLHTETPEVSVNDEGQWQTDCAAWYSVGTS